MHFFNYDLGNIETKLCGTVDRVVGLHFKTDSGGFGQGFINHVGTMFIGVVGFTITDFFYELNTGAVLNGHGKLTLKMLGQGASGYEAMLGDLGGGLFSQGKRRDGFPAVLFDPRPVGRSLGGVSS